MSSQLEVLDLCCGQFGWSEGFARAGFRCTGVDIVRRGKDYPGEFIKADLFDWQPIKHYPVVVGSPECKQFSIIKKHIHGTQDERQGLDLVFRVMYLINQIKPRYWILENVKGLSNFLGPPRHTVRYNIKKRSKTAYLWGNFPIPGMFEYLPKYEYRHFKNSHNRMKIPAPMSYAFAEAIKAELSITITS